MANINKMCGCSEAPTQAIGRVTEPLCMVLTRFTDLLFRKFHLDCKWMQIYWDGCTWKAAWSWGVLCRKNKRDSNNELQRTECLFISGVHSSKIVSTLHGLVQGSLKNPYSGDQILQTHPKIEGFPLFFLHRLGWFLIMTPVDGDVKELYLLYPAMIILYIPGCSSRSHYGINGTMDCCIMEVDWCSLKEHGWFSRVKVVEMFQFDSFFKWVAITHHRFANASEICLQKLCFGVSLSKMLSF